MSENLLMSISQDERERAIFRSRRKFETDCALDIATAEDRGKIIGNQEEKFEIAKNLMKMGMSSDQISKATGLTPAEVESLR